MANNICDNKEYRIIITSDIHHTQDKRWYGVLTDDRVQLWVDRIKEEHARRPIDLLIFAGDASLDHYLQQGSYTSRGISNSKEFAEKYLSQLPPEIPRFIGAGNHEKYNDEQWESFMGNKRQGAVALERDLFIILDTYSASLEPNFNGDLATYVPVDVDFIKQKMAEYPEHRVWLIAHYFDKKNETEEFKQLVKTEPRIKGMFAGHAHQCSIMDMGPEFGNKTVAQTGQFSYSWYTAFPSDDPGDVLRSFWGFRELITSDDESYSEYIIAESDLAVINGEPVKLERQTIHGITYQY